MNSGNILTLCLLVVALAIPKAIGNFRDSPQKSKRIVYRLIQVIGVIIAIIMAGFVRHLIKVATGIS